MVSVKFFQGCRISGDKQENSIVTTPVSKELLKLNIFRGFYIYFVKSPIIW